MERPFVVIDGSYQSQQFTDIEAARADARLCVSDESYSGCVEIYEYDEAQGTIGALVETPDCDEYGSR